MVWIKEGFTLHTVISNSDLPKFKAGRLLSPMTFYNWQEVQWFNPQAWKTGCLVDVRS